VIKEDENLKVAYNQRRHKNKVSIVSITSKPMESCKTECGLKRKRSYKRNLVKYGKKLKGTVYPNRLGSH